MTQPISLPRSTPEAQGVRSEGLLSFLKAVEEHGIELHSFMMARNNTVIAEGWWAPHHKDLPHMVFSLSKSFTATAIGFALTEGLLTLEDPVVNYCRPDLREGLDEKFHRLKIKHLLTMSTGQAKEPPALQSPDGDLEKGFFEEPPVYEPGTRFLYNSVASYMLSVILTRVTGQTLNEYLKPRLYEPLGITEPVWDTCPRGFNTGGWGLNLKTEDILKFGLLYLNKGCFNGRQLLPSAWIDEATRVQITNGDDPSSDCAQGYGYQFWRCRHQAYRGDGAFGQYCLVFPDQKTVMAVTGAVLDMQSVLNLIYDHLLPAMTHDSPLPETPYSRELQNTLKNLSYAPLKFMAHSEREASLNGQSFAFSANPIDLRRISFSFKENTLALTLEHGQGTSVFLAGREHWSCFTLPPLRFSAVVVMTLIGVGSYTWENDSTLVVTLRFYETPYHLTLRYSFSACGLTLVATPNMSIEGNSFFSFDAVQA
jgi:CubicO group peptidase (beta-lactamase class C family)